MEPIKNFEELEKFHKGGPGSGRKGNNKIEEKNISNWKNKEGKKVSVIKKRDKFFIKLGNNKYSGSYNTLKDIENSLKNYNFKKN